MKHAEFKKLHATVTEQRKSFGDAVAKETRHYLVSSSETEVIEVVVNPERCHDGTCHLQIRSHTPSMGGWGTTDITARGFAQFNADQLVTIATVQKMVEGWVKGETDHLSPSTLEIDPKTDAPFIDSSAKK